MATTPGRRDLSSLEDKINAALEASNRARLNIRTTSVRALG